MKKVNRKIERRGREGWKCACRFAGNIRLCSMASVNSCKKEWMLLRRILR
jgi:hypothetical protein